MAKNIVKPVVDTVETVLSKVDFTTTNNLGINVNVGFVYAAGTLDLSTDSDGNIAIQATGSGGICKALSAGASLMRSIGVTNAQSVDKLKGGAIVAGGSVAIPSIYKIALAAAAECSVFLDPKTKEVYNGIALAAGMATSAGAEGHLGYSHTVSIWTFNIFNAFDKAYEKIMEW